jgi:GT2 family glycosyltransferase
MLKFFRSVDALGKDAINSIARDPTRLKHLLVQNEAPLVSVIILNFNGEDYVKQCLFAVLETKYPNFEVVFVDNASTDSSLKIVEEAFGLDRRLRIIRNIKNMGFSGGNNIGFVHARGEYIAFLNNDTIADPYWLDVLVSTMEEDNTIGLAGSTILSMDGKKLRGAGGLWSDYLLFLCPLGAGRGSDFKFLPKFEVSFASGCSMIVKKELLDKIGLFDPEIPYNYDDTLLSLKTWLAGKRVVSVSNSRICHIGGATTKKFWNIQSVTFSLLRAKMCLLFDVFFNLKDLLRALSIFFVSISVDSTFLIKDKNLPEFLGNIHALTWMLRNFKHVWKNRLEHWSNSQISPKTLVSKFIRIKFPFPLCVTHSELAYSFYHSQCLMCENILIQG